LIGLFYTNIFNAVLFTPHKKTAENSRSVQHGKQHFVSHLKIKTMKKFAYIIAMLALPLEIFSQCTSACYSPEKLSTEKVVQISPNPGNGQFHVLFAKNHDIYTNMTAYDNSGRIVFQKEHLNGNPVQVDLSHLQPGIYLMTFTANNRMEHITERVAIVK